MREAISNRFKNYKKVVLQVEIELLGLHRNGLREFSLATSPKRTNLDISFIEDVFQCAVPKFGTLQSTYL